MEKTQGHHLVLGNLVDFITGKTLTDTHDERYRQKLAGLMVQEKGFLKKEIYPRNKLFISTANIKAIVNIDFKIVISGKVLMIIIFGPGSLTTRHRSALAASRLAEPYQIPVVVVSNGENADILNGKTGKVLHSGLNSIPDRSQLMNLADETDFTQITPRQVEMESRIIYAFEVDGRCPCDDTVCKL